MAIRFKCPHCKKPLAVKDHLGGKKAACPACKKMLVIPAPVAAPAPAAAPAPSAAELEAMAAAALAEDAAAEEAAKAEALAKQSIDFTCEFCDEEVHFPLSEAGKKAPCPNPECRRIIKIPIPQEEGPKDWRALLKKGPSAALINQPEQLEDAWGTEVKTRVSGTALEEAGATPEVPTEPVGIFGWIRRAFYTALLLGGVFLIYTVAQRQRANRSEKNAIQEGLAFVEPRAPSGKGSLRSKLPPVQTAEIYRGIGELYLGNDKRADALSSFRKARAALIDPTISSTIDPDLLLAELCRSLLELGGGEEEYRAGTRYIWTDEVQAELLSTLQQIQTDEARAYAMRILGTLLIDRKQPELAWSLATTLSKSGLRMQVQHIALLVGTGKAPPKDSLQPPELEKMKGGLALPVRIAFAEAAVRKGEYAQALQIAQFRGKGEVVAPDRLEASVGAALVLLEDPKRTDAAREAAPFFQEAISAYADAKGKVISPWLTLQLVRVGLLLGEEDKVKEAAKRLEGAYRNRAAMERVLGKLARTTEPLPIETMQNLDIDTKADKDKTTLALTWSHFARHHARYGSASRIRAEVEAMMDENLHPFLIVGAALGAQDNARR